MNEYLTNRIGICPEQPGHLDMADLRAAVMQLPIKQREALLLVAASEHSYDEAAKICRVPTGTIKSRVNRARIRLAEKLGSEGGYSLGGDPTMRAAVSSNGTQSYAVT